LSLLFLKVAKVSWDFNAQHYSIPELEVLFGLPSVYDPLILEEQYDLVLSRLADTSDEETWAKSADFLVEAKKRLLRYLISDGSAIAREAVEPVVKALREGHVITRDLIGAVKDSHEKDFAMGPVAVEEGGSYHYVQEKKNTNYSQSFPSEIYPGVINPLKKRIKVAYLNIDTRFRTNYHGSSSTDFHFTLPFKLQSVVTLQLLSFEIPNTIYAVSAAAGNNTFAVILGDGARLDVVVPDGNYSASSIVSFLNDYMQSVGGGGFGSIHFAYSLSSDGTTGTGKISVDSSGGAPFSLLFEEYKDYKDMPLTFGWLLGFRSPFYEGASLYVSEGEANFAGPRYLYLVFNDYNNNVENNFYCSFTNSLLSKNILARISINNVAPFQNIVQNNLNLVTFPRQYYGPVDIQKLNIQLLDEYGRPVNLNSMDYSFCVTLNRVYDL